MGLKQVVVLTHVPTSSASSQHASCLHPEQSAMELVTGSARWELRGNLWALVPVQFICNMCLVTVFNGARPCGGPFCTVATSSSIHRQKGNRSGRSGRPCAHRSQREALKPSGVSRAIRH
jgi:hypothetical protein